ncbi:type I-C CRISPR-associated protein Cas7/Csd2 [Pontivivens nitratireducens]|uniref:Type I-C CRISPR-associated protein Cas7/Csd2 n=1 Tax=Pontivivens nitratireducens TaxID=2758038 RepID=A0A6G7VNC2_9RHOB|nr:type I-C CRISPR-associated protein Cas7/Csd2 [Pontibrevibacter nitratireducens]QIK41521.1 type I-C CRISPR-associated protein Cas7/Csd2 [Pontibrevibacter nitratireducens]
MTAVTNRYDFVLFFDVENGNPNGDPDAGNLPRMDPETSQGLVTDVSLKRKLRNYVAEAKSEVPGHAIYMQEGVVLNQQHALAYEAEGLKSEAKKKPKKIEDATRITDWMCANFWDIRTFGAVMTTEVNAGQVRGPVQLTFAKSAEPIMPLEVSITRSSVTNVKDADKERTMGRKHVVPYGLYRAHGFINANLARRTGFSEDDLVLLWASFRDMFEHDRSAARGMMAARRLIAFRHDSALGNAQAHKLFDRVTVHRAHEGSTLPVGDGGTHNWPVARAFTDYAIRLDDADLPEGIEIIEPF